MVEQSEGNSNLCCCVIRGECSLEGFLDLGPGLVCISNVFIFKFGEPSLGKGFSSTLGHSVEANHDSCCVGVFDFVEGKIGLYGHEPSIGISSFSTEFFKEGCLNFHVILFFIGLRIYADGEMGETRG